MQTLPPLVVPDSSVRRRIVGKQEVAEPEGDMEVDYNRKRARDAHQEAWFAEQEKSRLLSPLLSLDWSKHGQMAPWMTEDGEVLPDDLVYAGMEKERASLRKFQVYETVAAEEVSKHPDAKVIRSRWVLRRKEGGVKARLVVCEVNYGSWQECFAATPTTVGRLLMFRETLQRDWLLVCADVATAFLHASLPADSHIYIIPPQTEDDYKTGELWRLIKALYGLRQAPRLFQEWLALALMEIGFRRLRSDAQCYVKHPWQALLTVHADDILLGVPSAGFAKLKLELEKISL